MVGWFDFVEVEVIVCGKGNKECKVLVGCKVIDVLNVWFVVCGEFVKYDLYLLFVLVCGNWMLLGVVCECVKCVVFVVGIFVNVYLYVLCYLFVMYVL